MKIPFMSFLNALMGEPMREAYQPLGVTVDNDDAQWRPLSGDAKRDLLPMNQRRMQDLSLYLWESNLLANRLVELPLAYILAEGVSLKAEEAIVQDVLDGFWHDPVNNMGLKLVKKVRELALFGEQCYPVFVNEFSGKVRLGYLDPSMIETVVVDPDNGEQPIGIVTVRNKKNQALRYRVVINGDENEIFTARTREIRQSFGDGECFYFCINDLSNGRRGRSDLLPQIDWLDNYEQFMFGEGDRIQFLRAFLWDVTLAGANEDDVKRKASQIRSPAPGSVRVHNDAESWQALSPSLQAQDTEASARLFRNHILGGASIPEHWFGGAGDVNRATGEDMSGPAFKVMAMRQTFIGLMLTEIGRYVIRQWELAHNRREPDLSAPVYAFTVQFPEMVAKDTTKYAAALKEVTEAVGAAVTGGLMTRETAVMIINALASRLGVTIDAENELEALGQTTVGAATPAPNQGVMTEAASVPGLKPLPRQAVRPDAADTMLPELADAAQPMIDDMLATIAAMLASATDIPDAIAKLAGLYPEMDGRQLADVLANAMLAANLAGRGDV